MPKKNDNNIPENWEVAFMKAMQAQKKYRDQDILAYFSRPARSLNQRVMTDIKKLKKYEAIKPSSKDELNNFISKWPNIDPKTGLSLQDDELLIKAREAMIAAVHIFNGAGLHFRSELFVVTAIIAWTYLMHAWLKREGIEYWYKSKDGAILKTKQGADRYWELEKCINYLKCPLDRGTTDNLKFLLEIRHEIEHRSTSRVDEALGSKLQACAINFNRELKRLFGSQYGLERQLSIALQFVTFTVDQTSELKKASDLPPHIETAMNAFYGQMTEEERWDPAFAYRVNLVPVVGNHASSSDLAVQFITDPEKAREVNTILIRPVEKKRHKAGDIITMMHKEGYRKFTVSNHTNLAKQLGARNPEKNYGCPGEYKNQWFWYDSWISEVRKHCEENKDRYQQQIK